MKKYTRATTVERSLKSTLKAINDIYIIEEDPVETSYETGWSEEVMESLKKGRIVLPEAYKNFAEKFPCRGVVISKGNKCEYEIEVGDRVIYARLGVQRYQFNGRMLCDVRECDIHGIIQTN